MVAQTKLTVAVHCRSLTEIEKSSGNASVVNVKGSTVTIKDAQGKDLNYGFSDAFSGSSSKTDVFKSAVAPVVAKALQGYNVSVIAFGSTASEKSQVMYANNGIVPQFNKALFSQIKESSANFEFLVTASFFEIYNEKISDLLNPRDEDLTIHEHPKLGIFVNHLAELKCHTHDDIATYFSQGDKVRIVRSSGSGERIARTTAGFVVNILKRSRSKADDPGVSSRVLLLSVAGAENYRNAAPNAPDASKSLAAFTAVINAVASSGISSAPFQNSKITRLCRDSFGGNAHTVLLACLSPADCHREESSNTLVTANRAKEITNNPVINSVDVEEVVDQIRRNVLHLKDIITPDSPPERMAEMDALLENLRVAKTQLWESKESLSELYENERQQNLASQGLLQLVLSKRQVVDGSTEEELLQLQDKKDELMQQYKKQKEIVDSCKDQLQQLIAAFTSAQESGKLDEASTQTEVAKIHDLKEKLKQDNEILKDLRRKLKDVSDSQRDKRRNTPLSQGGARRNSEVQKAILDEERARMEKENEQFLQQEKEKLVSELAQEKAELQLRFLQGGNSSGSTDEMLALEMQVIEMRAEKYLLAAQAKIAEQEKQRIQEDLDNTCEAFKKELEIQQLQDLQTFRSYRAVHEDQKAMLASRYREVLEEAVRDSVQLAARNSELEQENAALKKELEKLKSS